MAALKQVLFLQLPQFDNDLNGNAENVPLAAACLQFAAEQAGEGRHYAFTRLPDRLQSASTPALLEAIVTTRPTVVACTLYLWNIERTLRLIRLLKTHLPHTRILLGGPEAAYSHPFLFRHSVADAIGVGEGETVFPALLRAFRTGRPVNYSTVALKSPTGYIWGTQAPLPVDLSRQIPPPGYEACRPDSRGMAYLETSRGCPMRCTYCRYPHLRRSLSFLDPAEIMNRVKALHRLGTTEIRFVDPTFNAHPRFRDIIRDLALYNRSGNLKFFAELNAVQITDEDARILAQAHFAEIEVGVQSRDAAVLKAIRRPTSLDQLDQGIRSLLRNRIKVTVDIMYGLPLQRVEDVRRSLRWALTLPGANVQCLQTLLLPGTELRDTGRKWRLKSEPRPPYAVTGTGTMTGEDFRAVEAMISRHPRLRSDVPTPRFAGKKLELFRDRIRVELNDLTSNIPDHSQPLDNRRAYLFSGADLFRHHKAIGRMIQTLIKHEPDALFQFVLCPKQEEPLDLLDYLIGVIRRQPTHLVDRYASVALDNKITSRRLMIQLPRTRKFARAWILEAESLLQSVFF